MPSDLHVHTTFSDGKLTPEEVVAAARAAGWLGSVPSKATGPSLSCRIQSVKKDESWYVITGRKSSWSMTEAI